MNKITNHPIDIEICSNFSNIITKIFKDIDEITYISNDPSFNEKRYKISSDIFIIHLLSSKKDCIMKDIVNTIGLPNSTASRRVEYLVGLGLIKRVLSKLDHRKVKLRLTKEGRKLSRKYFEYIYNTLNTIFKTFSISERQFLNEILSKIS